MSIESISALKRTTAMAMPTLDLKAFKVKNLIGNKKIIVYITLFYYLKLKNGKPRKKNIVY